MRVALFALEDRLACVTRLVEHVGDLVVVLVADDDINNSGV